MFPASTATGKVFDSQCLSRRGKKYAAKKIAQTRFFHLSKKKR
jgi:hypothetical protein